MENYGEDQLNEVVNAVAYYLANKIVYPNDDNTAELLNSIIDLLKSGTNECGAKLKIFMNKLADIQFNHHGHMGRQDLMIAYKRMNHACNIPLPEFKKYRVEETNTECENKVNETDRELKDKTTTVKEEKKQKAEYYDDIITMESLCALVIEYEKIHGNASVLDMRKDAIIVEALTKTGRTTKKAQYTRLTDVCDKLEEQHTHEKIEGRKNVTYKLVNNLKDKTMPSTCKDAWKDKRVTNGILKKSLLANVEKICDIIISLDKEFTRNDIADKLGVTQLKSEIIESYCLDVKATNEFNSRVNTQVATALDDSVFTNAIKERGYALESIERGKGKSKKISYTVTLIQDVGSDTQKNSQGEGNFAHNEGSERKIDDISIEERNNIVMKYSNEHSTFTILELLDEENIIKEVQPNGHERAYDKFRDTIKTLCDNNKLRKVGRGRYGKVGDRL